MMALSLWLSSGEALAAGDIWEDDEPLVSRLAAPVN
jgi:hypothetical protein